MSNPGETAQDLVRRANLALLAAKREGRPSASFQPEMEAAAQRRLRLETDLRRALERGEFECHYQPQVEVASGRIIGVEALVRWNHPRSGLLAPGAFIEAAEQTGLVAQLDRWVIEAACAQAQWWLTAGLDMGRMGINVSAATLQHVDLVEHLQAVLARTGLEARRVELEVTESGVMQRPDIAIATLRALRRIGVRVAVDDFGTGYSSLSYLQQFAIDTLKIDRSFVRSLSESSAARPVETGILKAIVALGRHLGLELVAEGVETVVQRDVLSDLGCDVVQGYLYSRPIPADELGRLLVAGVVVPARTPAT
jgi:EAL domain-containing protein (putative c-di-GMP-specific phosphodiesterase class I)